MKNIEELKKYEPLYIIGHKKPDVDTIISSYLLSNVLNALDIETYPCILDNNYEIDFYNKRIINDYLEFKPVIINDKDISKYNFILVDHNDPNQSIGINNKAVFCIDHHKNSNKLDNVLISNLCSNSLFIYDYFKDVYSFNEKEKELIMLTVLTDTLFLKTDRYQEKDKILVKELNIKLNSDKLLKKYFIETDLSIGMDKYLEKSDRDFSYLGIDFSSSVIQILNDRDNLLEKYRTAIKRKNGNHLGMLRILNENKTYVVFKLEDKMIEIKYDFIAGRASTVMPDIINYLKKIVN